MLLISKHIYFRENWPKVPPLLLIWGEVLYNMFWWLRSLKFILGYKVPKLPFLYNINLFEYYIVDLTDRFWKPNLKWRFCRSFRRRFQCRFYGGDFFGDFSGVDKKDCYDRVDFVGDFVGDFSGVTVCWSRRFSVELNQVCFRWRYHMHFDFCFEFLFREKPAW